MGTISLSYSMRTNLFNLQEIANRQAVVQNRLATGLKVSSPIENPSSYYVASSLTNRSNDLSNLLDSMGQTIQSLKNVSNTLSMGIKFLEQSKSIAYAALEKDFTPGPGPTPPPTPPTPGASSVTKDDISKIMKDNSISGSIVSSEAELINAVNNAKSGDTIVIFGKVNVNDKSLVIKDGVNIVGADSIIKDNNLEDDFYVDNVNKGKINFNFNGSTDSIGLVLESNTYVSDITINYHTINKTGKTFSAIRTYQGKNISLNNIDINVTSDSTSMFAMEAIYNNSGEINLTGTINISMNGYSSKGLHADYNGIYNQAKNSTINMKLDGQGIDAFRGGKMNLYGTNNIDIYTSGNLMSYGNNTVAGEFNVKYYKSNTTNSLFQNNNTNFKSDAIFNVESVDDVIKIIDKPNGKDTWEKGAQINYYSPITHKNWIAMSNGSYNGIASVGLEDSNDLSNPPYNWKENVLFIKARNPEVKSESSKNEIEKLFQLYNISVDNNNSDSAKKYNELFNSILNNYNSIISDGSYLGTNLLKENNIKVVFNEDGSSKLDINGIDASIKKLLINTFEWNSKEDVEKSIKEIEDSINLLRSYDSEFGNYYYIVSNREDFTKNMINILNEGADKLILTDINEDSANMLSLQTNQKLAINSLSLASQSASNILRLF